MINFKNITHKAENELVTPIDATEQQVRPLEKTYKLTSFNTSASGNPEDNQKAGEFNVKSNILNIADNNKISFSGNPDIGMYMKQYVFGTGARYKWDEMIKMATRSELTAKY